MEGEVIVTAENGERENWKNCLLLKKKKKIKNHFYFKLNIKQQSL